MGWEKLIHKGNVNTEELGLTRDSITTTVETSPDSGEKYLQTKADGSLVWLPIASSQLIYMKAKITATSSEIQHLMHPSAASGIYNNYWIDGYDISSNTLPSTIEIDMNYSGDLKDFNINMGYALPACKVNAFMGTCWSANAETWSLAFYHATLNTAAEHVTGTLIQSGADFTLNANETEQVFHIMTQSMSIGDVIIPVALRHDVGAPSGNGHFTVNGSFSIIQDL